MQHQTSKAPDNLERETGIGPASLAWKARVLPLNYSRAALPNQLTLNCLATRNRSNDAGFVLFTFQKQSESGGWGWIRTSVRVSEQIYSLPPLTTRTPILKRITDYAIDFQK